MSKLSRVGAIDLSFDPSFNERQWRLERLGWVVVAIVLLVACFGGLGGPGPLSSRVVQNSSRAVTIEYERLVRYDAETDVSILLGEAAISAPVKVVLDPEFGAAFLVEQVNPKPARESAGRHGVLFEFAQFEGPGRITFILKPRKIGSRESVVTVNDLEPVTVRHFVFP